MPSAAAIQGIGKYGLGWRFKLPIAAFVPKDVPELDIEEIPTVAQAIARQLRNRLGTVPQCDQLERISMAIEASTNHEELIRNLDWLYDWADFNRVLIT
jgi:hypothetical protein